jgi:O-antigen/teichoic acid export membrane protein
MQEKKAIIKDGFQVTFARYFSQGIGFFTSIGMRRFLGPFYTGMWSILNIAYDYSAYLLLGVNEGICYKIPFLAGQNKKDAEEEIKDAGFNFVFVVSVFTSILLLVTALIFRNKYPVEVVVGMLALSIYVILDRICGYYMSLLRGRKNFSVLSKSIIFDAIINIILVFSLVKNFKLYGLYITMIILSIMNTFFIHLLVRYRINLTFKFKGVSELIAIGFPLTVFGLLDWAIISADRIFIAKMIGVTFVGYYSVSIMAKNYISQISSFGTVLYPRIVETFSRGQRVEDIKKYALIPIRVNAYIMPFLLGMIFFIAPPFIEKVLPKFMPGILAIQILLIDMFFRSCLSIHFIAALKKQVTLIPITVFLLILTAIGDYLVLKNGYGIYGVAWVTSGISFLYFLLIQGYTMSHFAKAKEIISFFMEIIAPFLYTVLFMLIIGKFIRIHNIYINVAVRCLTLFAFSLPLFIYINSQTQVIKILIGVVKNSFLRRSA